MERQRSLAALRKVNKKQMPNDYKCISGRRQHTCHHWPLNDNDNINNGEDREKRTKTAGKLSLELARGYPIRCHHSPSCSPPSPKNSRALLRSQWLAGPSSNPLETPPPSAPPQRHPSAPAKWPRPCPTDHCPIAINESVCTLNLIKILIENQLHLADVGGTCQAELPDDGQIFFQRK